MELLKTLLKLSNLILPYRDFLYILQLEEYISSEYIEKLPRFFLKRNIEKRDRLKFTSRIQTTFTLTIIYQVFFVIYLWLATFQWLTPTLISIFLTPVFIFFANLTLNPIYNVLKRIKQKKAASIIARNPNTKIIAVAGSFGKTTTKNLIFEMIKYNYKTQLVEGNLNTPIGVAQWIINNYDSNTEYLIVEMDAFLPGAIRDICKITSPDIAVITNIKEQHMKRFADLKALIKAHEELFANNNQIALIAHSTVPTSKRPIHLIKVPNNYFDGQSESFKENAQLAVTLAVNLGISNDIIKDTVLNFKQPDRRQQLTELNGYQVIDDSYNVSFTTAKAAIDYGRLLSRENNKKLIVVTAGIPESDDHKLTNEKLGEYLEENVEKSIILKSIFSRYITNKTDNYKLVNNLTEACVYIKNNYLPNEILIVFLPELTDLYY